MMQKEKIIEFLAEACTEPSIREEGGTVEDLHAIITSIVDCKVEDVAPYYAIKKNEYRQNVYKGVKVQYPSGYSLVLSYFDIFEFDLELSYHDHWVKFLSLIHVLQYRRITPTLKEYFTDRYKEECLDAKLRPVNEKT